MTANYFDSGLRDFVRSSALRLVPHLRHAYVLILSFVSETITVLGLNSVAQLGHSANTVKFCSYQYIFINLIVLFYTIPIIL